MRAAKRRFALSLLLCLLVTAGLGLRAYAEPAEPKEAEPKGSLTDQLLERIEEAPADGTETAISLPAGEYEVEHTIVIPEGKNIRLTPEGGEVRFAPKVENGVCKFDGNKEQGFFLVEKGAVLTFSAENPEELLIDGKDFEFGMNPAAFLLARGTVNIDGAFFQNYGMAAGDIVYTAVAPLVADGADAKITLSKGGIRNNEINESGSYNGSKNTITDSAGALMLKNGASFDMTGGEISGNRCGAKNSYYFVGNYTNVGAVRVDFGSSFTMSGGTISSNRSSGTGAVLVGSANVYTVAVDQPEEQQQTHPLATFELSGGTIQSNLGLFMSGGAAVMVKGHMDMSGGSIAGNMSNMCGGIYTGDFYAKEVIIPLPYNGGMNGFYATVPGTLPYETWKKYYQATLRMTGGEITKNSAAYGGGISIGADGSELTAGSITNNSAFQQGGGIYVQSNPYVLELKNALITENSIQRMTGYQTKIAAKIDGKYQVYDITNWVGGGIWFCPTGMARFYLEDGSAIFDNTAYSAGDDFFSEKKSDYQYTVTLPTGVYGSPQT